MVSRKVQCRTSSTVHINGPPSAINALYVLEACNVAKAQSVYILHRRAVGEGTQQLVVYTRSGTAQAQSTSKKLCL